MERERLRRYPYTGVYSFQAIIEVVTAESLSAPNRYSALRFRRESFYPLKQMIFVIVVSL